MTTTTVDPQVNKCSGTGCDKDATMLCPNCVKLGKSAYFCSQECFAKNWKTHKFSHVVEDGNRQESWLTYRPEFSGFSFSGPLRPHRLSEWRVVPDHILKPDYAIDGIPHSEENKELGHIIIHTPEQIEKIRYVCKLTSEILSIAGKVAKPGVTTDEIDRVVHDACIERNCYPSPLNYNGFPKSCCTSVNEVICHGIPDMRELENGDIVNVDVSCFYDGYHGDMNETWFIGDVDEQSKLLVNTTKESLDLAIKSVRPGILFREIGNVISKHVNKQGLSVVRAYCGHGIGELFHGIPSIPHYAKNRTKGVMKVGNIFTIEPMINLGSYYAMLWDPDEWTATTKDGKRSAQFEHTLLVTETGCEVLTQREWGSYIDRF
jgi:methionyl aminopeptidase